MPNTASVRSAARCGNGHEPALTAASRWSLDGVLSTQYPTHSEAPGIYAHHVWKLERSCEGPKKGRTASSGRSLTGRGHSGTITIVMNRGDDGMGDCA